MVVFFAHYERMLKIAYNCCRLQSLYFSKEVSNNLDYTWSPSSNLALHTKKSNVQSKINIKIGIFLFQIEAIFRFVQQQIISSLTNFPNRKSDKNLHKLKAFLTFVSFFIQTKWNLINEITITIVIICFMALVKGKLIRNHWCGISVQYRERKRNN